MEKKFFSLFILIFLLAFVTSYAFCQENNNAESIRAVSQDRSINTSPWVCVDSMAYTTSDVKRLGVLTSTPEFPLTINGKMYLKNADRDTTDLWYRSYLYYQGQKLIIGTPPGRYAHNSLELMPGGSVSGSVFSQIKMYSAPTYLVNELKIQINTDHNTYFNNNGNFGIGTSSPQYKLDVHGIIRADEIRVNTTGADYVFEPDYHLQSLDSVSNYIKNNHHLPGIPSANEMKEQGLNLGEQQTILLQKIEELTLYIIEQQKQINELKQQLKQ